MRDEHEVKLIGLENYCYDQIIKIRYTDILFTDLVNLLNKQIDNLINQK